MIRAARWIALALTAGTLVLGSPGAAPAQEGEDSEDGAPELDLGGYVRTLTGIHDAGFQPPVGDRRSAFNAVVARLQWELRWADRIRVDVHQRLQARLSTSPGSGLGGSVAGFGVSADPGRAVDLESVWIDDERLQVRHDIDRLALTVYTGPADVTVGRQAITWGTAALFPVADLWSRFSPYELDTEQKPGVDAVRALAYPASGLEVDVVVADRGQRDAVSAGARASVNLPSADLYVAGGRFWDEALFVGGVSWILETTKLRLEAVLPRDLEADRWEDPRVTAGVDWLGSRLTLGAEYHFNGLGAGSAEEYLFRLGSESFARGESYYLGRHYLGALARWTADRGERVRLTGSVLVNLDDPSAALSPAFTWDLGDATRLTVGGLVTGGAVPRFPGVGLPELQSEFGSYGDLIWTRFSVYF